jgi:hypothetical protein
MVYCYKKRKNEKAETRRVGGARSRVYKTRRHGSGDANAKTPLFGANARALPEHATL